MACHHHSAAVIGLAFSTQGHLSWLHLALVLQSRALWVPCGWGQVSYYDSRPEGVTEGPALGHRPSWGP